MVVGIATWLAAAPLLHLSPVDPVLLGLAVAGSLLPDIDHPESWVGRRSRPFSSVLAATFGHRGVTHSAVAIVALSVLLARAGHGQAWAVAVTTGYLSHLLADMLTPRGLRLAWPLRRTWGYPLCKTGSPAEAIITLLLSCGIVWYLVRRTV